MNRALTLATFATPAAALACCVASNGTPVNLSNENVVIVWDERRHIEHFVRQADFDTKAKDFGFIVPTPAEPQLAVANPEVFKTLANLVPPPSHFGCAKADDEATPAAGGVDVLRTERVGDYQATVLRARDGNAMGEWLKKNGYVSRPAMVEWLDYYTKQNWVFTAFKFVADPEKTTTKALRLSFATEKPRYPYKMPKDTWPEGYHRSMNLYFIASSPITAQYVDSDTTWEARQLWFGPLPDGKLQSVASDLALKPGDLPERAVVTIFENGDNPDGYDHDLYFAGTFDWTVWRWAIGLASAVLVYVAIRRRPRSGSPLPSTS